MRGDEFVDGRRKQAGPGTTKPYVRDLFFAFYRISLTCTARQPTLTGRQPRASPAVQYSASLWRSLVNARRGGSSVERWLIYDRCARTRCVAHSRPPTAGERP
jgi:hypothetical protein